MDDAAKLLDLLADNARRPFGEALSLPPRVYASEAFHALEAERIFHREWLCVGRADDLPRRISWDCRSSRFARRPATSAPIRTSACIARCGW